MRTIALASAVMVLSVTACKQENNAQPAASTPSAAATPAAVASAAPIEPAGTSIPVPEDFEEEAKQTVTADTLNAQLDKLEKTIAAAPAK